MTTYKRLHAEVEIDDMQMARLVEARITNQEYIVHELATKLAVEILRAPGVLKLEETPDYARMRRRIRASVVLVEGQEARYEALTGVTKNPNDWRWK
jgi:hypothetical protein